MNQLTLILNLLNLDRCDRYSTFLQCTDNAVGVCPGICSSDLVPHTNCKRGRGFDSIFILQVLDLLHEFFPDCLSQHIFERAWRVTELFPEYIKNSDLQ